MHSRAHAVTHGGVRADLPHGRAQSPAQGSRAPAPAGGGSTTLAPTPGSRARVRSKWVPDQHGAWAMLAVPFAAGTFLGEPTWLHLPLFVCWLVAYATAFHLQQHIRLTRCSRNPRAAERHVRPFLVFATVLILLGTPLLVWRPWLVVAVAAALPFVAVNTFYALRNRERALVNGLVAIVPACAMLLVALRIGGGAPGGGVGPSLGEGVGPFIACLLYFGGTVLYVKSMIRERRNRRFLFASVAYHCAALTAATLLDPLLAVLFALCLLRAALLPGRGLRIRTVGLIELALSAVLLVTLLAL
ncbi:YwiC-like family protein [Streptomyces sp. NPDC051218]|uniref:YwiC-like family protein n=1 Tax=Streptomyces sp. NPDC051218 TaxID=3365645 RepID=UPI0037910AA7